MEEHDLQCPYCWQSISMLIDVSITQQTYIEDCEVCCNPIEVSVECAYNEIISLTAQSIEQ